MVLCFLASFCRLSTFGKMAAALQCRRFCTQPWCQVLHRETNSHPVNMPDPICSRSGSAGKYWPEAGRMILAHWLASGPEPFGQNVTKSARTKADPGWFLRSIIWDVCGRTEPSLKVGNWQRPGCFLPETGPDDSCTPACFQTRCVWPDPDQAIQIGSGSVLRDMIHAFFGKTVLQRMRSGRFWLNAGRNGHNWP